MVPLVIVGLSVKFDVSVVFLSGFVQEREVGRCSVAAATACSRLAAVAKPVPSRN